jgi:hypothetical protein
MVSMTGRIKLLNLAVVAALAGCDPGLPQSHDRAAAARDAQTVVDPHELVALAGGPTAADVLAARALGRGYPFERRDALAGLDLVMLTFRLPTGAHAPAAIRELEAMAPGVTVGLNHAYRAEPGAGGAGGRTYAGGLVAWPDTGCPAYLPVGVLDTGIGLGANSLPGASIVTRNLAEGAPAADAHGAAVVELLAGHGRLRDAQDFYAAVVGTVPDADPAAGVDAIMRAIDWLHGSGVRLVNVSLAGPYNKILDRGLAAAADRGMVIVAAVGNDGPNAPPRYPSAFGFVIAVTAVDADLAAYARAPRGSYVDFAAPGVDVFVPLASSGQYMTGTSIAAPFVTAVIASSAEAASLDSVATVRATLARDAIDLGAAGNDDTFGAGLARTSQSCLA